MKQKSFIAFFIFTHMIFIFLQIHKHTQFITCRYLHQESEKELDRMVVKKQMLLQKFHAHIDRESIKDYACTRLNMRPVTLRQVKKIN